MSDEQNTQTVDNLAAQDHRIMADGRPAWAWWKELQLLRKERQEREKVNNGKNS